MTQDKDEEERQRIADEARKKEEARKRAEADAAQQQAQADKKRRDDAAAAEEAAKKGQGHVKPPFSAPQKPQVASENPLNKITKEDLEVHLGKDSVKDFTPTPDGFTFRYMDKPMEVKGNAIILGDDSRESFEAAAKTAKACGSTGLDLSKLSGQLDEQKNPQKERILKDAYETAKSVGLNVSGLAPELEQKFANEMKGTAPTPQPPGGRG